MLHALPDRTLSIYLGLWLTLSALTCTPPVDGVGTQHRDQTNDPEIKSHMLFQVSYLGTPRQI